MPFIGSGHWIWIILILLIVLIIYGPGKLPDVGSGFGRAIREFRKASSELTDEIKREASAKSGESTTPPTTPETKTEPPAAGDKKP
jgi:sec-independent protein translocase protein TatA